MGIEGQLKDVSLADICQLLAMGRKTGCLTVTDKANFGYVYFKGGRVIYATVLNRPDRLGDLLVRNGVITREALQKAMEAQAQHPGKRLGQILVDLGSLTVEDLNRFITLQIEEAVYHLFTWEEGSFHFDPDQAPDEQGVMLVSINAESLLLEGARRVDELSQIQKKISSNDMIFAVERLPQPGDDVELSKEQEKLLKLLDGKRTVDQLIDESGLVEFEVLKGLYGLLMAGFIHLAGKKESARAPASGDAVAAQHLNLGNAFYRAGMLEDAEREYGIALQHAPKDETAHSRLASIALRSGRAEKALEHFDAVSGPRASPTLLRNRAVALELLGRFPEALEAIERALAARKNDPALLLQRGVVRFKNRESREAVAAFQQYRKALGAGTTPPPIYFAYALLATAASGDMDGALRIGREGLTLYPGNGPILVNLGVVLEWKGEADAAEALYLRAVGETPPVPQAHKNLGDLAYRRGDQAGARAHYERALRLKPTLGDDLYLKLGNLVYKDGDREWAVQLWKKALELNPGNEVVRTNLELISAAPGR